MVYLSHKYHLQAGYYLAGNEPSFQTPIGYHYANHPAQSVDRVRQIVFENFDISASHFPSFLFLTLTDACTMT